MSLTLRQLLAERENPRVDFKRDASSPMGIVKDVIGFSNRSGGTIVVGVDDDGTVVGLTNPQDVELVVVQSVFDSTNPQLSLNPMIATHAETGLEVLIVEVHYFQWHEPVRHTNGTVYERIGSASTPAADDRVEAMARERQQRRGFDQLVAVGSSLQDLDLLDARARFLARGIELDDAKLKTFEIVVETGAGLMPTNGGLLLFGPRPQTVLPDATCLCARFPGRRKGKDMVAKDQFREGSMLTLLDKMYGFIDDNNGLAAWIQGRTRKELRHYDALVIREALNNAVAHADFSASGKRFYIHMFDDRLVIESPGPWVSGMDASQAKLGHSRTRNRAIARCMSELGLIEEHGTFWSKAVEAHERDGYPLPDWEDTGHSLRTVLPVHPAALGAPVTVLTTSAKPKAVRKTNAQRKAQIRAELESGEKASREIAAALAVTERHVQRLVREMTAESTVEGNGAPEFSPTYKVRLANHDSTPTLPKVGVIRRPNPDIAQGRG